LRASNRAASCLNSVRHFVICVQKKLANWQSTLVQLLRGRALHASILDTIDYYRSILARYRARKPDGGYPCVLINSLDVEKGIAMLNAGRLDALADCLASGLEPLVRAGADFGFMAANTPHLVFDELQRRSPIPLLSIVRATADRAKVLGLKKVGLFGTGFTMRANFYSEEFQRELT